MRENECETEAGTTSVRREIECERENECVRERARDGEWLSV